MTSLLSRKVLNRKARGNLESPSFKSNWQRMGVSRTRKGCCRLKLARKKHRICLWQKISMKIKTVTEFLAMKASCILSKDINS